MSTRRSIVAIALALSLMAPATIGAAPSGTLNIPISQALVGIGTFTGQFAVNQFKIINGQLNAIGTLTGRITDTAGNLLGTIATTLTVPISNANGSCSILHLTLGPLDLDLLGLKVHLDQVVLDISAQPGPGNLLGNLLCQIADLLNGTPSNLLANLLNQLLAAL